METNRRTIIKGAGTVAVTGGTVALASACGSGDSSGSGDSGEASKSASVKASEVPVGSGTVIDETYVVTQPKDGEFYAFTSVCTHQGCQVRTVTETQIVCPCHSSEFSTTTGEVLAGPATEPLQKFSVTDEGGTLTIS